MHKKFRQVIRQVLYKIQFLYNYDKKKGLLVYISHASNTSVGFLLYYFLLPLFYKSNTSTFGFSTFVCIPSASSWIVPITTDSTSPIGYSNTLSPASILFPQVGHTASALIIYSFSAPSLRHGYEHLSYHPLPTECQIHIHIFHNGILNP